MKKTILLCSSVLLMTGMACKSKKDSTSTAPAQKTAAAPVCEVKVSFGSPGTGIDAKKYDEIKLLIEGKKLKYTEKTAGREGEREICLPLTELQKDEKSAFIERLKKSAAEGQYVSVSGN